MARGARPAPATGGLFRRAFAFDLDPNRATHDIEFFNPHANPRNKWVTQNFVRDPARQRLDQIDMASPEDDFDGVDNYVVGENAAHVVKSPLVASHLHVDVKTHVLVLNAFEVIGADGAWEHKIVHEYQIGLDDLLVGRNIASSQQEAPIEPRLAGSALTIGFARNEIPDHPHGCRVDRGLARPPSA